MTALKSVLGASYSVDFADIEVFLEASIHQSSIEDYQTTMYNSIEELLIQEMIEQESMLTDRQLKHLVNLYTIDFDVLKDAPPKALTSL